MTVKDLIEQLKSCDGDAEVILSLGFSEKELGSDRVKDGAVPVPVDGLVNSLPGRMFVEDNGDFVMVEAQVGHVSGD
jgi:hypothetical protein